MKICGKCGNAVKDNARFCGVCGAVLAGDEQLGVDTVFEPSEKPAAAKAPSNAQGHLDSEYDRMVKRDMGFKSPVDSDLDGKKQVRRRINQKEGPLSPLFIYFSYLLYRTALLI